MSIISKLATSLNRRDELPNKSLAKEIVSANDNKAIKELIFNLDNKSPAIQSDLIKTIYEIALLKPVLISPYINQLLRLLESKNNRLVWGGMMALDAITSEIPRKINNAIEKIIEAADNGSVITNDRCVSILAKLCTNIKYAASAFPFLIERIRVSPLNQFPMYAEKAFPVINAGNKAIFLETLQSRMSEIETDAKRRRLDKIIKEVKAMG